MDLIDREKALGCFWAYEDGDETEMPAYDRLQALPVVAEVEDCISRQDAIDAFKKELTGGESKGNYVTICSAVGYKGAKQILESLPSAQPRKGKWIEKEVHENPKAAGIEEWQSCKCSVCGRYDTRPYSYYFDEPHYCSWCGAEMRGGEDGQ